MTSPTVFISYCRKNLDKASDITSRIERDYGMGVWIDLEGIESGKQFINVIISAIDACYAVLFLLTKESALSAFCRNEITYASNSGKQVFVLNLDGTGTDSWLEALCPSEHIYDITDLDICIQDMQLTETTGTAEAEDEVDGHACVDMGLSVRWATANMNVDSPLQCGSGYRWGEIQPGDTTENWSEYVFSHHWELAHRFDRYSCEDRQTQLLPEDDAASILWGPGWRIPCRKDWEELLEQCVWTWQEYTTPDGTLKAGYLITSKLNRNSIFLPANATTEKETKVPNAGLYWTSELALFDNGFQKDDTNSYLLSYTKSRVEISDCKRIQVSGIRPVAPKEQLITKTVKDWCLPDETGILAGKLFSVFIYSDWDSYPLAGYIESILRSETDLEVSRFSGLDKVCNNPSEELLGKLKGQDVFIVVFSNSQNSSRDTRRVVRYALNNGKTLIPVCSASRRLSGWQLFEFGSIGVVDGHSDKQLTLLVESVRKLAGEKTRIYMNHLKDFHEGLAAVFAGKWGYMDISGRTAIDIAYHEAGSFSEGLAPVRRYALWGYIDRMGRETIPFRFSVASEFSEGLAFVCMPDGTKGYVDHSGKIIVDAMHFSECGSFHEGFARVCNDGHFGYIDRTGKLVLPCVFDDAMDFSEGLACVGIHGGGYGFISSSGEFPLHHRFAAARSFSEGRAAVFDGRKWGYVDKNCHVVIPFIYDDAYPYSEGLACVCLKNRFGFSERYGFIDADGNLLCFGEDGGLTGDFSSLRFIHQFPAVEPAAFHGGIVRISKGSRSGYATKDGNWLLDPSKSQYFAAGDFHDGRAIVSREGLYYILTESGEEIAYYGIPRLYHNDKQP